jgi:hypothetical protein
MAINAIIKGKTECDYASISDIVRKKLVQFSDIDTLRTHNRLVNPFVYQDSNADDSFDNDNSNNNNSSNNNNNNNNSNCSSSSSNNNSNNNNNNSMVDTKHQQSERPALSAVQLERRRRYRNQMNGMQEKHARTSNVYFKHHIPSKSDVADLIANLSHEVRSRAAEARRENESKREEAGDTDDTHSTHIPAHLAEIYAEAERKRVVDGMVAFVTARAMTDEREAHAHALNSAVPKKVKKIARLKIETATNIHMPALLRKMNADIDERNKLNQE